MIIHRISEQTYRDEIKRLRGKTARRRNKTISDKLHQVHKPWHEREHQSPTGRSRQDTQ